MRLPAAVAVVAAGAAGALAFTGGGDTAGVSVAPEARAARPDQERIVELPGLAVLRWRCDDQRRFHVEVHVPRGGATTEVSSGGQPARRLHPRDNFKAAVAEDGRHRLRMLQRVAPMTRTLRVQLAFGVRPQTGLCVLKTLRIVERRDSNIG